MGDKLIQTLNDYDKDKEVFNGDIGTVERIDVVEHQVAVRFDDRMVKYDFGELDEVAPAYAVTIHQSPGSEFRAVVIPLARQAHAAAKELDLHGLYSAEFAFSSYSSNSAYFGGWRRSRMALAEPHGFGPQRSAEVQTAGSKTWAKPLKTRDRALVVFIRFRGPRALKDRGGIALPRSQLAPIFRGYIGFMEIHPI
jgi:hypothetical protein